MTGLAYANDKQILEAIPHSNVSVLQGVCHQRNFLVKEIWFEILHEGFIIFKKKNGRFVHQNHFPGWLGRKGAINNCYSRNVSKTGVSSNHDLSERPAVRVHRRRFEAARGQPTMSYPSGAEAEQNTRSERSWNSTFLPWLLPYGRSHVGLFFLDILKH